MTRLTWVTRLIRRMFSSDRMREGSGGARTVKHAKLPISSFDESVSHIRSSLQEMLAHLKTENYI